MVDIPDNDPIFHTVYNLNERYQVPGQAHVRRATKCRQQRRPLARHLRRQGPRHGGHRFNSDMGDAWEWADDPRYPAKFSDLAIRLGVNYVVYAMTH